MSKFKVGDRVRRVKDAHMGMVVGDVSTVMCIASFGHVELADYGGQHDVLLLELVDPVADSGPVRTVTRREIVPGEYGIVRVARNGDVRVEGRLLRPVNAYELREAARIFNEIADVLEGHASFDRQKEVA